MHRGNVDDAPPVARAHARQVMYADAVADGSGCE